MKGIDEVVVEWEEWEVAVDGGTQIGQVGNNLWHKDTQKEHTLTFSTLQAHCVAKPIISLASAGALCRRAKGVCSSRFVYIISVARKLYAVISDWKQG